MKELIDIIWNMEAWKASFMIVIICGVIYNMRKGGSHE
jgi:hypothetical protein